MSSIRNLLCAALTLGVLLSASNAHARFGKRSRSSDSSENKTHHDASAVGDDDDEDNGSSSGSSGGASRGSSGRSSSAADAVSTGLALLDLFVTVADIAASSERHETRTVTVASDEAVDAPPEVRTSSQSSPLILRLGAEGSLMGPGSGVNLSLGIEGERMGVDGRLMMIGLPTEDGLPGTDDITLMSAHLTYALVAQDRMRLRLESGLSLANAPDMTAAGPSIALSFEACLAGPLDVELRAQATPFPYRQLDAQAGLALHLHALVMRGGWRGIFLDDAGLVDGVVHQDAFGGPYLGLGFVF